jgi:hypothetical protein
MDLPSFSMQSLVRSGVNLIRPSIDSCGMAPHSSFNILFNSSIDVGPLGAIASFIIDHTFSITDKSGEFAGQSGIRLI